MSGTPPPPRGGCAAAGLGSRQQGRAAGRQGWAAGAARPQVADGTRASDGSVKRHQIASGGVFQYPRCTPSPDARGVPGGAPSLCTRPAMLELRAHPLRPLRVSSLRAFDAWPRAGQLRRSAAERPHRVRVSRRHAHFLGRKRRPPHPAAQGPHEFRAPPAPPRRVVSSNARSTPARAQVYCVAALPNGQIVSGSLDDTLIVWDVSDAQGYNYSPWRVWRSQRSDEARLDTQ